MPMIIHNYQVCTRTVLGNRSRKRKHLKVGWDFWYLQEMRKDKQWEALRYWAAFTLQGEWR